MNSAATLRLHLCVALAIAGAVAATRSARSQQDDYRSAYTSVRSNDSITAPPGAPPALAEFLAVRAPKILYAISAADCNVCLGNLQTFNRTALRYPDARQLVVIFETAAPLARRLLGEYGLDHLPMIAYPEPDSAVMRALRLLRTPVCYVLDAGNHVTTFDKLGGSVLTPRMLDAVLLPELRLRREHDIPLNLDGEPYVSGRLLFPRFDARNNRFFVYDFTFHTLLMFTPDGAIRFQAKSDLSGRPFLKPKGLQIPTGAADCDLVMFDFAPHNEGHFAVRRITLPKHAGDSLRVRSERFLFRPRPGDTTAHVDTDFNYRVDAQPKEYLETDGARMVTLMPSAADWASPDRLMRVGSFTMMADTLGDRLAYAQSGPVIPPDSAFLACFGNDSTDRLIDPPNTYPSLTTLANDRVGFFFAEVNRLHILDASGREVERVTLGVDGFNTTYECRMRRQSSIERVLPYRDGYLVLYRRHVFTPESNFTTGDGRYSLQYLAADGTPRSHPCEVPPTLYLEEVCLVGDRLCAVTHEKGEFGLAVFAVEGIP